MRSILITDIVMVHRFTAAPGWKYNEYRFTRDYHGIVFVLEGSAIYCFNDNRKVLLKKGMCMYLPKNTLYSTVCNSKEGFDHLTVNFRMADESTISTRWFCVQPRSYNSFRQLFGKMVHEWNNHHPFYRERCMGILYELVATMLAEELAVPQQHLSRLLPARSYLEKHFRENLRIGELSTLCGMSETYFRRLFYSVFHETPIEYQTTLRIKLACDLLVTEKYSVAEIAGECGYQDSAYFSRVFKKTVGICPTHYHILVSQSQ